MLNAMRRSASGFATKLLLAFLVLTFAVWGIEDMVRNPGGRAVATIGDSTISTQAFQGAVRRETENLRRSMGDNYTPDIVKALQPERRALQTLIQQNLLRQESVALGIIPSDKDVVRRIHANPMFHDSQGNFDKQRLQMVFERSRISEKDYVESLRQDMASNLMLDALSIPVPVFDIAVRTMFAAQEEERQVTIYTLNESLAGTIPAPKTGELEQYFSDHAQEFIAPEQRTVSYIIVTPEQAIKKDALPKEAVFDAYKNRLDEFRRPERRAVEQLLFNEKKEADEAAAALAAGKSFDSIAKTANIINKDSISLGKVERNNILENAADEVFSLSENGVSNPVESPFGWHVFYVREIEAPGAVPFEEVRPMLEKELLQQSQENSLNDYLNNLEDTLAGGATLAEAAKEFHLEVKTIGPMLRDGSKPSGGKVTLPELDKFLDTAFSTEAQTESPLVHSGGGTFYIVRADEVNPERNRSLDEVLGTVTAAWKKSEQQRKLNEIADTVAKKMADPKTRTNVLAEHRLSPTFTGTVKRSSEKAGNLSLPPIFVEDIFSRMPGESTDAYRLASGPYAIAVPGKLIPAGQIDKAIAAQIESSISQSMAGEVAEEYMRYLTRKYPVSINEELVKAASGDNAY